MNNIVSNFTSLTSFSIPNLGNVDVFELHCWQNTWPQARQWCRLTINVNAVRHLNVAIIKIRFERFCISINHKNSHSNLWQTSPSAHSGAVSAENIASDSLSGGNLCPSAFKIFTVSCQQRIKENISSLHRYSSNFYIRWTLVYR